MIATWEAEEQNQSFAMAGTAKTKWCAFTLFTVFVAHFAYPSH